MANWASALGTTGDFELSKALHANVRGPDGREFSLERLTAPDANDNDGDDDEHDDGDVVGGQRGMNSGNFAIGQSFAIGELRCLLAAWFGAFETVLADEAYVPVVRGGITVKPKDGLHVRPRPLGAEGERRGRIR